MNEAALLVVAIAAGAAGWLIGRRRASRQFQAGVSPHLLPDPALEWLRRAHRAVGVWITELDPNEEGPRAERIIEPERVIRLMRRATLFMGVPAFYTRRVASPPLTREEAAGMRVFAIGLGDDRPAIDALVRARRQHV